MKSCWRRAGLVPIAGLPNAERGCIDDGTDAPPTVTLCFPPGLGLCRCPSPILLRNSFLSLSLAVMTLSCPPSEGSSPLPTPLFSAPSTPETERDYDCFDLALAALPPVNAAAQYILVTGGLGYIGSHTALELLKTGYNVLLVDNLSNSYREVFERILQAAKQHYEREGGPCPQAELACMDYRDTPAMRALLAAHTTQDPDSTPRSNITGVIHFAAYKEVHDSLRNPLKYYQNNISGLVDFVALLDQHHIKTFIFSSSANVYGTQSATHPTLREEHCVHRPETYCAPDGQLMAVEQGCTGITNPYGRTKFFGEAILSDLAASDPSWTILGLRYFNPVGCDASGLLAEDPRGTPSNLVPVVVKVLTGELLELSIYGDDWTTPDGTAIRDFIHVSDVARGHIAALTAAQEGRVVESFRTFNLGTGCGHSVAEVVAAMETVSQRAIPRRTAGRRPGDVESCVAIADRAAVELGWKAERSLQDACHDLWRHLRDGKAGGL
ncbi:udp-glucose 4-epimerase [Aspergillus homomorphus CBS 101889]|uniref:Udp-glucose 4-epimerase n=1 Tax=Aspergillus homomorphus (strain CBS 101889) TaxID=1450537 RepID=A0A395HSC4_ASPHC|nr:udp-glucose 4-epimerase [Aspergillus homomorphus CBS 101889]RAL10680.1 udp-glucose 4-epimerase [Aspergillus homomorphus CBS 101889]